MHIIKTGSKNNGNGIQSLFIHLFQDKIFESAATLSYYFLFSVFPLAIFISAIFSNLDISFDTLSPLSNLIPSQILTFLRNYLDEVSLINTKPLMLFGIVLTIYSMSKVIAIIKRKFRLAYRTSPKIPLLQEWAVSLVFVFLILISFYALLILIVSGNRIFHWILTAFPFLKNIEFSIHFLRILIATVYLFFVLFGIYFILPGVKQSWVKILPGTLFSMIALVLMSWFFSFYIDNISNYSMIYGSLGTIIALMTWLFLFNFILLLGAYINSYIYLKQEGSDK